MELVRGIKITEYCDQNNLTTKERLDLFSQVCRAIQHAHQEGHYSPNETLTYVARTSMTNSTLQDKSYAAKSHRKNRAG